MDNKEDMAEQTIFITGSTDGLGRETARETASRGATVLLHGRDPERAEATIGEIDERLVTRGSTTTLQTLHPLRRCENVCHFRG
jgi:NAD(P)-dependent dehydrogenase (short-subunit alcohol dehydrogenase family)